MKIKYTITPSPIGKVLIAQSEKGLCTVQIRSSQAELERTVRSRFSGAEIVRDDKALAPLRSMILQMVAGKRPRGKVPLDLSGTAFQKSVWKELQRIPAGATRSYGEVARAIGKPKAFRAVAQACGANPVPVLIPCHRVIAGDGGLGGFTGGLHIKRALLGAEGVELS
jgi:AraC family transcriptional regulator of adaptative response/methylated-DNA-[protein]-cysteine methyltransferase